MQETYDGIWREIASRIRLHISADAFRCHGSKLNQPTKVEMTQPVEPA
jgi:hypothetical protein